MLGSAPCKQQRNVSLHNVQIRSEETEENSGNSTPCCFRILSFDRHATTTIDLNPPYILVCRILSMFLTFALPSDVSICTCKKKFAKPQSCTSFTALSMPLMLQGFYGTNIEVSPYHVHHGYFPIFGMVDSLGLSKSFVVARERNYMLIS
jgi:hypothetical protein